MKQRSDKCSFKNTSYFFTSSKVFCLIFLSASLSTYFITANAGPTYGTTKKKVLISQVMEHPAFTATINGITNALEQAGYKRGDNLVLRCESAQANASLAAQIANKFVNQNPDVVVGIGTISAQSFIKYASVGKVKFIFSSITDPIEANLIKSLQNSTINTSGVSNFVDLEPQIKLFKQIQPKLKRLGFLYNPGEINSISILKKLEEICPKFDLILVKQTIAKTADVPQSAIKLAMHSDAIFISNDSTALSSLQSIIKVTKIAKIPTYVSDTDAVELGALAALGPNQYEIGTQTGKMIARILNGDDLSTIPVEFPTSSNIYVNLETATSLNIDIPQYVLKDAKLIKRSKS